MRTVGLILLPFLMWAHHGWQEFHESQEITLNGVVTDFHFVNPHCVIEFEAANADKPTGKASWQAEFSSPGPMARKGWTAATLQPGDKIVIRGHPGKDGVRAVHVTLIRLQDGREFKINDGR